MKTLADERDPEGRAILERMIETALAADDLEPEEHRELTQLRAALQRGANRESLQTYFGELFATTAAP